MVPRYGHAKPNERQQRIRQPVHPAQIPRRAVTPRKIEPDVKEFVNAQTGQEVDLEAVCL